MAIESHNNKVMGQKVDSYQREYFQIKSEYDEKMEGHLKAEERVRESNNQLKKFEVNLEFNDFPQEIQEEKLALNAKNKHLERQIQHLTQLRSVVETENEQLNVQIEKLRTELREEQRKTESSGVTHSKHQAEKLGYKQKIAAMEETIKSLQDVIQIRKQNSAKLEEQLATANYQIEELKQENARLLGKLCQFEQKI